MYPYRIKYKVFSFFHINTNYELAIHYSSADTHIASASSQSFDIISVFTIFP